METLMKTTVKTATWLLFFISSMFLTYLTWHAVHGTPANFTAQFSATIVAGLVTATWLVMIGRLHYQLDQNRHEQITTKFLLIVGLAVDIAVAAMLVLNWRFPPQATIAVIAGHVLTHVIQIWVSSSEKAKERFAETYKTPEEKMVVLQQQNAVLLQQVETLKQKDSSITTKLETMLEEQGKMYIKECDECDWESDPKDSPQSAQRALNAHKGIAHREKEPSKNGHHAPVSITE